MHIMCWNGFNCGIYCVKHEFERVKIHLDSEIFGALMSTKYTQSVIYINDMVTNIRCS